MASKQETRKRFAPRPAAAAEAPAPAAAQPGAAATPNEALTEALRREFAATKREAARRAAKGGGKPLVEVDWSALGPEDDVEPAATRWLDWAEIRAKEGKHDDTLDAMRHAHGFDRVPKDMPALPVEPLIKWPAPPRKSKLAECLLAPVAPSCTTCGGMGKVVTISSKSGWTAWKPCPACVEL